MPDTKHQEPTAERADAQGGEQGAADPVAELREALSRAEAGHLAVDLLTAIPTVTASPPLFGVITQLENSESPLRQ